MEGRLEGVDEYFELEGRLVGVAAEEVGASHTLEE